MEIRGQSDKEHFDEGEYEQCDKIRIGLAGLTFNEARLAEAEEQTLCEKVHRQFSALIKIR